MPPNPYVDPQTIHNPATGTAPPASWGDGVRDALEALVRAPKARVARETDLVLAATTLTPVPWTVTRHQQAGNLIWTAANPTRLVAPWDGVYHYATHVTFPFIAASYAGLFPRVNGVTYVNDNYKPAGTVVGPSLEVADDLSLVAGDYLEVVAYAGAACTVIGSAVSMGASMHWVGLL